MPPDEFYVLGDNRNNSMDSRTWDDGHGGSVSTTALKGRAVYVLAPSPRSLTGAPSFSTPATPERARGLADCLAHAPSVAKSTPPAPSFARREADVP